MLSTNTQPAVRKVLFVISSNPRTSHRPAEAIRIVAGLSTWRRMALSVYLRGAGVLALGECVEDLVDDEAFARYLPLLRGNLDALYVEKDQAFLAELGNPALEFHAISNRELAALSADSDYVLHF